MTSVDHSENKEARQFRIAIVLFVLMLVTGGTGTYFATTADFLAPDDPRATAGIALIAATVGLLLMALYFYARSEGWSRRGALIALGWITLLMVIFAVPGGPGKIISTIFYWPLDQLGR